MEKYEPKLEFPDGSEGGEGWVGGRGRFNLMVGVWIFAGTTQKEKHRTKDNTPLKALKLFFLLLFVCFIFYFLFF